MRAFDADELRERVDEVLYYIWDPIGVAEDPFARGEYGNYVTQVLQLLVGNNHVEPISTHLDNIMRSNMGLGQTNNAVMPLLRYY